MGSLVWYVHDTYTTYLNQVKVTYSTVVSYTLVGVSFYCCVFPVLYWLSLVQ